MQNHWMQEKATRKLNPWIVLFVIFTLAYFAVKTQAPVSLASRWDQSFCFGPRVIGMAMDNGPISQLRSAIVDFHR